MGLRIAGTGRFVPERRVTNDDLAQRLDTSDDWVRSRTGIGARHLLAEDSATSDMVVAASRLALEDAGITAEELDLIVVATVTPDMPMPSASVIAQHKLGARCPAFDLAAACAGFSYGLSVVNSLIRSGDYQKILFVGAEALGKFVDWNDRATCVLFGDGAGAIVAVPSEDPERGLLAADIRADGSFVADLWIPGGGTAAPPTAETVAAGLHYLKMNGRTIFTQAVRLMSESCETVLARAGLTIGDVDLMIPHQANLRIIDAVGRRLGISAERVLVNIEDYGNTSAASIPIALDEAARDGRLTPGQVVLTCGLGAGLTWGAAVLRW
jgi:3-oxoacyl-[acyl-carrier-protein] synthase-3